MDREGFGRPFAIRIVSRKWSVVTGLPARHPLDTAAFPALGCDGNDDKAGSGRYSLELPIAEACRSPFPFAWPPDVWR